MAGTVVGATATRTKLAVGANSLTVAIAADFVVSQAAGFDTLATIETPEIPTQPDGNPWTIAALNVISSLILEQDYNTPDRFFVDVWNCTIEVYAEVGPEEPFRKVPVKAPVFTPRLPSGINVDPKGATSGGVIRVPYNTGAFRPAGPDEPGYTQQGFNPTPFRKTPNPKP